jgi:hypothetical protein
MEYPRAIDGWFVNFATERMSFGQAAAGAAAWQRVRSHRGRLIHGLGAIAVIEPPLQPAAPMIGNQGTADAGSVVRWRSPAQDSVSDSYSRRRTHAPTPSRHSLATVGCRIAALRWHFMFPTCLALAIEPLVVGSERIAIG